MCEELHDPFEDQVACARYRAERDALAQRIEEVASEIDRTLLGVEGIEDAPAMRWARGLREALGALHAPARDTTMSAHDLLPEAERLRSIAAVVGERLWGSSDAVPDGLTVDVLRGELERRIMPEGMEWPRYEDGEPFIPGDDGSVEFFGDGIMNVWINGDHQHLTRGERVRRPAPKVLDADGAPIKVGDTVWNERDCSFKVSGIRPERKDGDSVDCDAGGVTYRYHPDQLTHHRSVLDADGEPIHEGDHGWWVEYPGVEIVVKHIDPDECDQLTVCDVHGRGNTISADEFTHTKPEIDTWERIEEDADALVDAEINGEGSCNAANAYCNRRGLGEGTSFVLMAQDLVRRCKALAGVSD